MKIEPIYRAMNYLEKTVGRPRYVLLSPQGKIFDEDTAIRYARSKHLCLVCGRYEGLDERVLNLVDEEVSIGDFVLSGGEIPALVLIDAITRCIPGVLGNEQSSIDESFGGGLLEYPQFTRPDIFMDMEVPPVLLSGNHEEIRKWRRREALKKTIFKRPDLMNRFMPSDEDRKMIREIMEEIPE